MTLQCLHNVFITSFVFSLKYRSCKGKVAYKNNITCIFVWQLVKRYKHSYIFLYVSQKDHLLFVQPRYINDELNDILTLISCAAVRSTDKTNGPYLHGIKTTRTTDNVTDLNLPSSILMISLTAKWSLKRQIAKTIDCKFDRSPDWSLERSILSRSRPVVWSVAFAIYGYTSGCTTY